MKILVIFIRSAEECLLFQTVRPFDPAALFRCKTLIYSSWGGPCRLRSLCHFLFYYTRILYYMSFVANVYMAVGRADPQKGGDGELNKWLDRANVHHIVRRMGG